MLTAVVSKRCRWQDPEISTQEVRRLRRTTQDWMDGPRIIRRLKMLKGGFATGIDYFSSCYIEHTGGSITHVGRSVLVLMVLRSLALMMGNFKTSRMLERKWSAGNEYASHVFLKLVCSHGDARDDATSFSAECFMFIPSYGLSMKLTPSLPTDRITATYGKQRNLPRISVNSKVHRFFVCLYSAAVLNTES